MAPTTNVVDCTQAPNCECLQKKGLGKLGDLLGVLVEDISDAYISRVSLRGG